jgi:hypothetical protein
MWASGERKIVVNPLDALDYPRQSLYNLGRSLYKGVSGEGTVDDIVSALPAALGLIGGGIAAPFTGGASIPIGMALAGGAQAGGHLLDDERFNAASPSELLKAIGYDDADPLSTFLTQMATDPMTYLTGAGAIKGGSKIASMFGKAAPAAETAAEVAAAGKSAAPLAALGEGDTIAKLTKAREALPAMLGSPERKALEAMTLQSLESSVPIGPFRPNARTRTGTMTAPTGSSLDIGFEPGFETFGGGKGTMVPSNTQRSALLEALAGGEGTLDIPGLPNPDRMVRLGSPELTSEALGAAERTMPGGYRLKAASEEAPQRMFEGMPKKLMPKDAMTAEERKMAAALDALLNRDKPYRPVGGTTL